MARHRHHAGALRVPIFFSRRNIFFGCFVLFLALFSGTAFIPKAEAHTFDTSSHQTRTRNTSGVTFNHTCGSGTTLLTLTIVVGGTTARTGGAPTYNGIALTQADQNGQAPAGAETIVELWYLLDPGTGNSYQISIPDDNNVYLTADASSYKATSGYKTVLKTDDDDGNTSTNPTGPSLTGLASGDVLVAVVGSGATTWAPSARTGTQLYDVDDGSYGDGAQYLIKTDSSDTAMGWTFGTSDDWSVVEAAFTEISPIDQEGFRFRNDDGSESAATWMQNQDTDASQNKNTNVRLRMLLDTPSDPVSIPFRLEYKKSTDSVYKKVLASESGSSTHTFVNSKRWKGNGSPSARAFDCGTDATLLVLTIVGAGTTQRAGGAPTYNGVALTQADQTRGGATGYETSAELWYLIDPPSGANTISVPNTGAITLYATASSYSAGDGYTSAFDASGFNEATTGANPSASVSASVAGDVYVAVLGDGLATAPTARTGTALAEVDDGSYSDNHQYYIKAGTGSQTISWTIASDDHAMVVAAFKVVAVSQPILLGDSSYISAGGSTNTTAQLTAPSGKTTSSFTAGYIQDDTNPSNSVDIANNFYTEMEWSVIATSSATVGDVYQFRITRNGTPIYTYSVTPQLTITGATISISGSADGSESATVKVAINGTLKAQTGTISSGSWSISGVGEPTSGDVVTVWIDSVGDSAEAIGITKYAGSNITGMVLNALTLSLGSSDNQTISNTNISQYDNSVSSNEDIFYDVDSNDDLTVCSASGSTGCTLSVLSGNTYRPDSGSSGNVTAENLSNVGSLTADGNTIYVSGSFTSSGTFNANTSTVNFNGTGSQTIPALNYYNLIGSSVGTNNLQLDTANITVITDSSLNSASGSHTVPSGTDLLVVMLQGWVTGETDADGGPPSSMVWNNGSGNQNLTRISLSSFTSWGYSQHGLWYLESPNPGIGGTITISGGDSTVSDGGIIHILNLSGVDTSIGTSGIRSIDNTFSNSNATLTLAPTTTATDLILAQWSQQTSTSTAGQTYGGTSGTQVIEDGTGFNSDAAFLTTSQPTGSGQNITFLENGSGTLPSGTALSIATSFSYGPRTLASSGTIGVAGTFTPGPSAYTVTGSTVDFNGSSAQTVNAGFTYNNLQVRPSANSITTNFAAGTVTVNGDLTIGNGTNTSVVVSANNASTTITVAGSISISANTTLQANASNSLTISDDFTNNGTFTHNNGSVVFNDNSKTSSLNYSANTTFYNLSITTGGKTVEFDESQGTIVTHALTVTGSGCTTGRVFLKSVTNGNQWDITVTGATVSVSYADVHDGNAVTTAITASNSTADNDNNTNWTISGGACGGNANPDAPTSLTQKNSSDVAITESAWTNSNTPKLGFTITDPDSDTVKYEVQVATDSGFSALVLDYTHGSFSASGTTFEFIVGTYGSGSCSGTCSATLSDSATGYWWRVKAIDSNSAESTYVEFGVAGTMDFKVDATAPTGGTVNDGASGDEDWNNGTLTSLSSNWSGFDSNVSGLSKYEYALRRQPDGYYWSVCSGGGSWQASANWCDNSTTTSYTQSNLNLATGVTYYTSVRATDNAGNVGTPIDSNGEQVLPTLSFSLSTNTITFSNLNNGNSYTDTKTLTVTTSTNASSGYTVKAYNTANLTSLENPSDTVSDFSGNWSTPLTWSGGTYGFGYTSSDTDVQGSNRFGGGTKYAAFTQSSPGDVVADHTSAIDGSTGAVSNEQFTVTYKVSVSNAQPAATYQTSSIYIVTANY